jgi:hypothetical protein
MLAEFAGSIAVGLMIAVVGVVAGFIYCRRQASK